METMELAPAPSADSAGSRPTKELPFVDTIANATENVFIPLDATAAEIKSKLLSTNQAK